MSDIASWFAELPSKLDPAKAGDMKASYCFKIAGEGGGDWTVAVAEGKCSVAAEAQDADLTILIKAEDWRELISGKLDPMSAFSAGKLRLEGNMMLGMQIAGLFLKG